MNNFNMFSNIAFSINGFNVYYYGIIISLAILVAFFVAMSFCKNKGYSTEIPLDIGLAVLPSGIIGARLFSVLFDDSLKFSDFLNFRTGGMSIIGAVIGGAIGLNLYCTIFKKKNQLRYFDTLAVALILAQAIGRWGNFFNQEVYGQVIEAGSPLAFFPFAVKIDADGQFHQALFFYEFVLDLIGFAILTGFYSKSNKEGLVTALYLIYYGIIRTYLETLRETQYVLKLAGFPISQICSGAMIVVGLILLIVVLVKNKKLKKVAENE